MCGNKQNKDKGYTFAMIILLQFSVRYNSTEKDTWSK